MEAEKMTKSRLLTKLTVLGRFVKGKRKPGRPKKKYPVSEYAKYMRYKYLHKKKKTIYD